MAPWILLSTMDSVNPTVLGGLHYMLLFSTDFLLFSTKMHMFD
jgi:hypothetical protein